MQPETNLSICIFFHPCCFKKNS